MSYLFLMLFGLSAVFGATVAESVQTGGILKMVMRGEPKTFDPFLVEEHRAAYREYLMRRLESPREWMEDAAAARTLRV